MFLGARRALVLGAHTDDEFGCSGTICRMVEAGTEVHVACFSSCEESVPAGFDKDVLKHESAAAMKVLGIEPARFHLYDYRVRHFPAFRQEILEELVRLRARIQPDLVLLPALTDIHQDHQVIAHEGLRAFKHSTILGYELPMNERSFPNSCYVKLGPEHIAKKIAHLECYRSQLGRPYARPEFLRSLATVRGLQMNEQAAESFEVLRLMVR